MASGCPSPEIAHVFSNALNFVLSLFKFITGCPFGQSLAGLRCSTILPGLGSSWCSACHQTFTHKSSLKHTSCRAPWRMKPQSGQHVPLHFSGCKTSTESVTYTFFTFNFLTETLHAFKSTWQLGSAFLLSEQINWKILLSRSGSSPQSRAGCSGVRPGATRSPLLQARGLSPLSLPSRWPVGFWLFGLVKHLSKTHSSLPG